MECMYNTQGQYSCKKISDEKRIVFLQPDKCEFVKSAKVKSSESAYKYENCPKTCENKGMVYDGNWTKYSCRCCKQ